MRGLPSTSDPQAFTNYQDSMTHELKIGLLAAICIAVTVWGYKFMKGKNILNASNYYYVNYENVDELAATSPVLIRGLRVGTVAKVELSEDMQSIIATLDINKGVKVPKNTIAVITSTSIMGGKAVVLKFDQPCSGDGCADKGDYLQGKVEGMIEGMLSGENIDSAISKIKSGVGDIFSVVSDSLSSPHTDSEVAKSFQDLQAVLRNLASITSQLDASLAKYDKNIDGSLRNLNILSKELADNSEKIGVTMTNLETITTSFAENDIGGKAAKTLEETGYAVEDLQVVLSKAEASFASMQGLMKDIENGKGSLGKLINQDEFHDNLNKTLTNLELLLQDFRLNPKRYVNVSVFGKKQKEYSVPEDDPAFEEGQN